MKTRHPLDTWRQEQGWSQAELARRIGATEAAVSKLFSGQSKALSRRAALDAWALTSGSVDLKTLLLGSGIGESQPATARNRSKRGGR